MLVQLGHNNMEKKVLAAKPRTNKLGKGLQPKKRIATYQ
jgi:hypothetical protein